MRYIVNIGQKVTLNDVLISPVTLLDKELLQWALLMLSLSWESPLSTRSSSPFSMVMLSHQSSFCLFEGADDTGDWSCDVDGPLLKKNDKFSAH